MTEPTNKVFYNQNERVDVLNNRIFNRNKPTGINEVKFSVRPVSTKYDMMSIYDRRDKSSVPIKNKQFNVNNSFNPGTYKGPFTGFVNNIDNESILRNQFFALQNNEQSVYVPSSKSDMYEVNVVGSNIEQPHKDLFMEPNLASFNPNPNNEKVGFNLFNNYTRQQVKNV
tara:strand:+ start:1027 stop:1536 length:510 start_codon:yes stop_codon:yes gene_type:complete